MVEETTGTGLRPAKSRIVVVDRVYWQVQGSQPKEVTCPSFSRHVESDEEPYCRRMKVGREWQKLDLGWIEKCGMLLLSNPKPIWAVVPTEEQKIEAYAKVLKVGIYAGTNTAVFATIPVGESLRLYPVNPHLYRILALADLSICIVNALPE